MCVLPLIPARVRVRRASCAVLLLLCALRLNTRTRRQPPADHTNTGWVDWWASPQSHHPNATAFVAKTDLSGKHILWQTFLEDLSPWATKYGFNKTRLALGCSSQAGSHCLHRPVRLSTTAELPRNSTNAQVI